MNYFSRQFFSVNTVFNLIRSSLVIIFMITGCSSLNLNNETTKKFLITSLPYETNIEIDDEFRQLYKSLSNHENAVEYEFYPALQQYNSNPFFKCRKPAYHDYFSHRQNLKIELSNECGAYYPFSVAKNFSPNEIIMVDKNLVHSIHLVFAEPGDSVISEFGHVALRLIICPNSESSAKECNENIEEHLVLGYRANIDDLSIKYIKGIFGGYDAHLYAFHFLDFYKEYAISEFRNLHSTKLTLTKEDIERLLSFLTQAHWSFKGNYKFITNNCATMLQDLIKIALKKRNNVLHETTFWRPDNFFENALNTGFADSAYKENLSLAEEMGYFFPSTERYYAKAFSLISDQFFNNNIKDYQSYILISPKDRGYLLSERLSNIQSLKLIQALNLLEQYISIQVERDIRAKLQNFFGGDSADEIIHNIEVHTTIEAFDYFRKCIYQSVEDKLKPEAPNLGIPTRHDLEKAEEITINCNTFKQSEAILSINKVLSSLYPSDWSEISALVSNWVSVIQNIQLLNERYYQLTQDTK